MKKFNFKKAVSFSAFIALSMFATHSVFAQDLAVEDNSSENIENTEEVSPHVDEVLVDSIIEGSAEETQAVIETPVVETVETQIPQAQTEEVVEEEEPVRAIYIEPTSRAALRGSRAESVRESVRNYAGLSIGSAEGAALNGYIDLGLRDGHDRVQGNGILGLGGIAVRGRFATDYLEYRRNFDIRSTTTGTVRVTPGVARLLLGTIGFYAAAEPTVSLGLNSEFRVNRSALRTRFLAELGAALGVNCHSGDCSGVVGALIGVGAGGELQLPGSLLRRFSVYLDFMYRTVAGLGGGGNSTSYNMDLGLRRLDDNGCEQFSFGFRGTQEGNLNFAGLTFSMPLDGTRVSRNSQRQCIGTRDAEERSEEVQGEFDDLPTAQDLENEESFLSRAQ